MKKISIIAVIIFLNFSVHAFGYEAQFPKGIAIGISMGQRAGDLSAGIDVTSPYFQNKYAIRLGEDLRLKEGVPIGGTKDMIEPYYSTRIGFIRGIMLDNGIRMYGEIGGMILFPGNALDSSTVPNFSLYEHCGGEFIINNKNNIFKAYESIYFEIGFEVNASGNDRFNKLNTSLLMGTGPTACAGIRFYL